MEQKEWLWSLEPGTNETIQKNLTLSDYRNLGLSPDGVQYVFRGAFDDEASVAKISDRIAYKEAILFCGVVISADYQLEQATVWWAVQEGEDENIDTLCLKEWKVGENYWGAAISFINWLSTPDEESRKVEQVDMFAGSDNFFKKACDEHYTQLHPKRSAPDYPPATPKHLRTNTSELA